MSDASICSSTSLRVSVTNTLAGGAPGALLAASAAAGLAALAGHGGLRVAATLAADGSASLLAQPSGGLYTASQALDGIASLLLAPLVVAGAMGWPGASFAPVRADVAFATLILAPPAVQTGLQTFAAMRGGFEGTVGAAINRPSAPSNAACAYTYVTPVELVTVALTALGGVAFLLRRALATCLGAPSGGCGGASASAVSFFLWTGYLAHVWAAVGLAALGCAPATGVWGFYARANGLAWGAGASLSRFLAFQAAAAAMALGGGGGGADFDSLAGYAPGTPDSIAEWLPKTRR